MTTSGMEWYLGLNAEPDIDSPASLDSERLKSRRSLRRTLAAALSYEPTATTAGPRLLRGAREELARVSYASAGDESSIFSVCRRHGVAATCPASSVPSSYDDYTQASPATFGALMKALRSAQVAETARSRWQRPCEAMFRFLAENAPEQLRPHLTRTDYSAGLRARAVEAAGEISETGVAVELLLPLLGASEPIIREAAVYALHSHKTDVVLERLQRLAADPYTTAGVRAAAIEALEED